MITNTKASSSHPERAASSIHEIDAPVSQIASLNSSRLYSGVPTLAALKAIEDGLAGGNAGAAAEVFNYAHVNSEMRDEPITSTPASAEQMVGRRSWRNKIPCEDDTITGVAPRRGISPARSTITMLSSTLSGSGASTLPPPYVAYD
jgi:hypothetical protein